MKTTVNISQFRDAFRQCGRQDQFSYEGLGLLFDYFEELDPDMELDVIAICCDYSEDSPADIAQHHGEVDCTDRDVTDWLTDRTSVIGTTKAGDIVYLQF